MREVLSRVRMVLGGRAFVAAWALVTLLGCALTTQPLLNQPGYELGALVALLHGLTGGMLTLLLSRRPDARPVIDALVVSGLLWGSATLAFLVATVVALGTTPCDPFATALFFPVLTVPSALVSASLGALVGRFTRRWWTQSLAWLVVVLLSAAWTTWPILFGPQVFAYDHLAGYVPGPLYDEELHFPVALLWFRLASVLLATGVLASVAARRRLALVALGALALLESQGTRLGFRMTDEVLSDRLGGLKQDEHLTLHYPASLSSRDLERVFADVRFRVAQVEQFLGPSPGRVTVWWYESAAQKQALVGAAHTQFSKPWRREVHVNAIELPHPVVKHELVHALASAWGAPPFGVTAWHGLIPNAGLIEGLAVAADNPVDDLTLHQWAAAMQRKHLLPDIASLFEGSGFYAAPPSRAYAAAGSFVRWLVETGGPERVRIVYRDGDFEKAWGRPLAALVADYLRFLDGVSLDEGAVNQAFSRFKRGSLFERPCAREVALLTERAAGEASPLALKTLRRCHELQPHETAHVLTQARVLRRLDGDAEAMALLDPVLADPEVDTNAFAEAALERAVLAVRGGQVAFARALLAQVVAKHPSTALERTALVMSGGLESRGVRRHFENASDPTTLYLLRDELVTNDQWPARYLLGRRLTQAGEPAEALPWLLRTLEDPSTPPLVALESTRLALDAAGTSGQCDVLRHLAEDRSLDANLLARARDWLDRCQFNAVAPDPRPK